MYSPKKITKSSNTCDAIKVIKRPSTIYQNVYGNIAPFKITVEKNVISIKITRKDYLTFVSFNILHL